MRLIRIMLALALAGTGIALAAPTAGSAAAVTAPRVVLYQGGGDPTQFGPAVQPPGVNTLSTDPETITTTNDGTLEEDTSLTASGVTDGGEWWYDPSPTYVELHAFYWEEPDGTTVLAQNLTDAVGWYDLGNGVFTPECLAWEPYNTLDVQYIRLNLNNYTWSKATSSCTAALSDTAVVTSLSGGGQSGASISVPAGTAVTDTAILSGANASTATGTVTYDVYSDSACTVAVPAGAGTAEAITTPGTLPASSPVTLSTAGTYYWQASYSGDANNGPSTSTCGTAGEVETVAPPSCGSAAGGYDVPSSWTTQKVNGLTPGVDPLNVVISSCSNVSLDDILKGMSGWESVPSPCVSPEQANVTGTFADQQQSWRLDGCQGGAWTLARSGTENHARLWNQPIAGSQYGAWFISASYETACVINARDTMVPVRDTTLNEAQFLVRSALGLGWHCIDGSQGSIGADGYNRGAHDFVAAIQAAAVSQKWDVSVQTIQTPGRTGEGHVTPGGSAAENAIAQFSGTIYVVTVDSATSTP